jgi:PIN domain nuclease of toxin-antitoxin system
LIYLDTHVVVWLYAGLAEKFSVLARSLINKHELYISPMVRLELQYLFEIGRVTERSDIVLADLLSRIGLKICESDFNLIVEQALRVDWTRDPFDRLIVANALINGDILLTKDRNILTNYTNAKWN